MPTMNTWADKWPLMEEICPCDVHFNAWIADRQLRGKTIYHFGTGTHHVVGREQAENGSGNAVFAITASAEEYEAYVELVAGNPRVARSYLAYFGDVYLTNPRILPEFDVVTLFHLCEFFLPNTVSADYGGRTDLDLATLFADKTRSGGHILFYTGSIAFAKTQGVIAQWEQARPVERIGEFKSLLVYRKRPE